MTSFPNVRDAPHGIVESAYTAAGGDPELAVLLVVTLIRRGILRSGAQGVLMLGRRPDLRVAA